MNAQANIISQKMPKEIQEVREDIQHYYVMPTTDQSLNDNAIRGMLNGLDPHCAYLDKQDLQDLTDNDQGKFSGIGIEVNMKNGLLYVMTALEGGPAQKAGMKTGDIIIRLNDIPVLGMSLESAIEQMRGPLNSIMTLTFMRGTQISVVPQTIKIQRAVIHVPSVHYKILDTTSRGFYGYIKISQFQYSTPQEVDKAIKDFQNNTLPVQGVVLDLRDNPGGLLNAAIAVADNFLDVSSKNKPIIVSTRGRYPAAIFTARATPGDKLHNVPLIILINGDSASGAEVVAGALKDNHRAILMGMKTFGKGSVQSLIPLTKDTAIKLTTALYYTPNGTSIQAEGITPDIVIQPAVITMDATSGPTNQLSEAQLSGHLTVNDIRRDRKIIQDTAQNEDYLIYQALNILKGVTLLTQ